MQREVVVGVIATIVSLAGGALLAKPAIDRVAATARLPRLAGTLRGPADRVAPDGARVAAYWWSIGTEGEHAHEDCSGRDRDHLTLDGVPITFAGADPDDVGLVDDDRDGEHGRPYMFDLGSIEPHRRDEVPPGLCDGASDDAGYVQTAIPDGARVEVAACAHGDSIDACAGDVRGVIAVSLADYFAHARAAALRPLRIAIWIAAIVVALCARSVFERARRRGRS